MLLWWSIPPSQAPTQITWLRIVKERSIPQGQEGRSLYSDLLSRQAFNAGFSINRVTYITYEKHQPNCLSTAKLLVLSLFAEPHHLKRMAHYTDAQTHVNTWMQLITINFNITAKPLIIKKPSNYPFIGTPSFIATAYFNSCPYIEHTTLRYA